MKNFRPSFKLLFGGVSLIAIFAFGVFSCSKSTSNDEIVAGNSYISVLGQKLSYLNMGRDTQYLVSDVGDKDTYKLFLNVKNNFSGDIDGLLQTPKHIIYFTNSNPDKISKEDVKAISIITLNDGKFHQKLYRIQEGKSVEDKNFDSFCTYFYPAEIRHLGGIITANQNLNILHLTAYEQKSTNLSKPIEKFNDFGARVANNSSVLAVQDGCAPCSGDGCCRQDANNPIERYCSDCPCLVNDLNELSSNTANSRLSNAVNKLNVLKAHSFRDDFLSKTKIGKKYKSYYYKISYVVQTFKVFNTMNFAKNFSFASKIYNCADKLQNGNDNDVILDEKFTAETLNFIKDFENVSTNQEYKAILKDIEKDVIKYSMKNRKEILATIQ